MAKFKIKYKEIEGISSKYIHKECVVEAMTESKAKDVFFEQHNGYDGIRRPRIWVEDVEEIMEEDATQTGNIAGPTSIFGSKSDNKVDDVYMELLNLEDYK